MDKQARINLWYLIFAVLAIWALQDVLRNVAAVETIPYSRFETLLDEDAIEAVTVHADRIEGRYRVEQGSGATRFVTVRVPPEVVERLKAADVDFEGARPNTLLVAFLSWILPALLLLGLWIYLFRGIADRQGMGGMLAVGKSRAKVYVEKDTGKTFADVAGVDEAKAELQEIVDFLKDPQRYGRLGARIPKGVLLVGPPGTGKTLMARAVAGEAGVPFFSISGSEFVEMFVGVGAARVRDLFEQAARQAPAIIFIDELDALGRARGSGQFSGNDEREQTLNQLLVELDGFDTSEGLVLLAATNRPEILDPALLRAGRFDRQVLVDRPDRTGRVAILRVHMKQVNVDPELDAEQIAALTTGFTGADLANLVNEAALLATREQSSQVTLDHFTRAIERIVAGLEKKNRLINPQERRAVAFHEMGHALVSLLLPGVDPVHKVSIIPRGIGSLGYTIQRPTEDRYLMSRSELEHKIAVLLAGRAAEVLVFDALSTGAADDLAKATDIARTMVMTYGMDEGLGHASYEQPPSGPMGTPGGPPGFGMRKYSETTAAAIDAAVARLIEQGFERATALLARNRALLERGAAELLAHETLDQDALESLLGGMRGEEPAGAEASALPVSSARGAGNPVAGPDG